MDKVELLYKNYGILAEAKDDIGKHEDLFIEILNAVKGNGNEKKLASQFISRFYIHFPHLIEEAFSALLFLCEDTDVTTRKQVIRDLPVLCKGGGEETSVRVFRVADVLAQLLLTDDTSEFNVVHNSLVTLFKIDQKNTLRGLFNQVLSGDDLVREKCLKYLSSRLKTLGDSKPKEVEECVLDECKKVLCDVTAAEFVAVMQILSSLNLSKTVSGQQQLVDILKSQAELDKPFDCNDPDIVDRLLQCCKQALPFFSCMVHSSPFVIYISEQVLPVISEIKNLGEGIDIQLEIFKLLADLSSNCGPLSNPKSTMEFLLNKLQEYMPLPPTEENAENSVPQDIPKLEFSYVECLMYAFHQLGRNHPDFLTNDLNADVAKDFYLRLHYFARGLQEYIKKLRDALNVKKVGGLNSEEHKLKVAALRTTTNINVLIKDLCHSPPSYKTKIILSWKPPQTNSNQKPTITPAATTDTGNGTTRTESVKRHTPITFDEDSASKTKKLATPGKTFREIYIPPSGKYSTKVGNFSFPRGSAGGRRGRGGRGGGWSGRRVGKSEMTAFECTHNENAQLSQSQVEREKEWCICGNHHLLEDCLLEIY
ncbi:Apoptosis inhibitor 5 [Chamberlinius hualienensis]